MIMKRATKRLADEGLPQLEVHKGLYGYSVRDKRAAKQRNVVHNTVEGAVNAAIAGVMPEVLAT